MVTQEQRFEQENPEQTTEEKRRQARVVEQDESFLDDEQAFEAESPEQAIRERREQAERITTREEPRRREAPISEEARFEAEQPRQTTQERTRQARRSRRRRDASGGSVQKPIDLKEGGTAITELVSRILKGDIDPSVVTGQQFFVSGQGDKRIQTTGFKLSTREGFAVKNEIERQKQQQGLDTFIRRAFSELQGGGRPDLGKEGLEIADPERGATGAQLKATVLTLHPTGEFNRGILEAIKDGATETLTGRPTQATKIKLANEAAELAIRPELADAIRKSIPKDDYIQFLMDAQWIDQLKNERDKGRLSDADFADYLAFLRVTRPNDTATTILATGIPAARVVKFFIKASRLSKLRIPNRVPTKQEFNEFLRAQVSTTTAGPGFGPRVTTKTIPRTTQPSKPTQGGRRPGQPSTERSRLPAKPQSGQDVADMLAEIAKRNTVTEAATTARTVVIPKTKVPPLTTRTARNAQQAAKILEAEKQARFDVLQRLAENYKSDFAKRVAARNLAGYSEQTLAKINANLEEALRAETLRRLAQIGIETTPSKFPAAITVGSGSGEGLFKAIQQLGEAASDAINKAEAELLRQELTQSEIEELTEGQTQTQPQTDTETQAIGNPRTRSETDTEAATDTSTETETETETKPEPETEPITEPVRDEQLEELLDDPEPPPSETPPDEPPPPIDESPPPPPETPPLLPNLTTIAPPGSQEPEKRETMDGQQRLDFPEVEGQFVEWVGWRQGAFIQYKNLVTNEEKISDDPLFGIVPDRLGLSPFESFRIISYSERRPTVRELELGVVKVNIGERGLEFRSRPEARRDSFFRIRM